MKQNMKDSDVYRQLIEANQQTFDCGFYTTAYHALAAALDYARETQNMNQVLTIELLASKQADLLEKTFAAKKRSTQQALQEHWTHIFRVLANQAHARASILKSHAERSDVLKFLNLDG